MEFNLQSIARDLCRQFNVRSTRSGPIMGQVALSDELLELYYDTGYDEYGRVGAEQVEDAILFALEGCMNRRWIPDDWVIVIQQTGYGHYALLDHIRA